MNLAPAPPSKWLKPLAYAAVYIGWGTTYLAIRVGVQSFTPAAYLGLRFVIAAVALVPILAWQGAFRRERAEGDDGGGSLRDPRAMAHSSVLGFGLLVTGLLPLSYAEITLPSNIAAVVIGCSPAGFAFFDWLLNRVAIRWTTALGLLLGISGVAVLAFGGDQLEADAGALPTRVDFRGLALVTGGFLAWSFSSVASRRLTPARPALLNVFVQYAAAAAILLAFAALFEGFGPGSLAGHTRDAWISLVYIALGPSLISYTSYLWLLRNEPSERVSTYAFVNPIVAVVAGALILDESTGPHILGALALVLAGTGMLFVGKKRI
jgi:drug/metabolite transporter (DMT)-like permease